MLTDYSKENPFYHNYIFSKADFVRDKIQWWEYPFLWFFHTYVQINDGWVFHFKMFQGRIYLLKIEPLCHSEKIKE